MIADFARSRVFPALDEFASAHRIHTSVDHCLLTLLAQRMVYLGLPPADLITTVTQAAAIAAERRGAPARSTATGTPLGTPRAESGPE